MRSLVRGFPIVYTLGGVEYTDPTLITVMGRAVTAAAGVLRYSTLGRRPAAADHSVTAGKQYIITQILWRATAAGVTFSLHYGDTDLGASAVGPLINGQPLDTTNATGTGPWISSAANLLHRENVAFRVPTGKFVTVACMSASETVTILVLGVEVPG